VWLALPSPLPSPLPPPPFRERICSSGQDGFDAVCHLQAAEGRHPEHAWEQRARGEACHVEDIGADAGEADRGHDSEGMEEGHSHRGVDTKVRSEHCQSDNDADLPSLKQDDREVELEEVEKADAWLVHLWVVPLA
jgi:hypothetical protein